MNTRTLRVSLIAMLGLMTFGCMQQQAQPAAGPKEPVVKRIAVEELRTVVVDAPASVRAADLAQQIQSVQAKWALLFYDADSASYAELAKTTGLILSRSRQPNMGSLAFVGLSKPEGDTTIALPAGTGRPLLMHDALYRFDKDRYLDLLAVRMEPATGARDAVRALLNYIATDVQSTAAIVLAIKPASQVMGDSITTLLRPALFNTLDCKGASASNASSAGFIFFYGPEVRLECTEIRSMPAQTSSIFARFIFPAFK